MERVLITGASGFVGFHLINEALKNDLEVFAAVRKTSNIEHLKSLGIQFTHLNFDNVEMLVKDLEEKQYTYIIHAAGVTAAKTEADYNHINAYYTRNLALAATKANIPLKKFVFISSLAAIGPLQNIGGLIQDNTTPNPVTAYGRSKLLAEEKLSQLTSLPLITLRPTAVYGPRDKDIFIILKKFSQGVEPYIGNIEQQLSFIYVEDLAKVTVQALFSALTHKTYNLSDGKTYDRYALANYSKQILDKKTIRFHLPMFIVRSLAWVLEKASAYSNTTPALNIEKLKELTAPNWVCDIERSKTDLGFDPKYDLEKGLIATFKWYKADHWILSCNIVLPMPDNNLTLQYSKISQPDIEARNGHKGAVVWFTGLSGSGKSTIAAETELKLFQKGIHVYVLDGDNLRLGLNKGLSFSDADRTENIRRAAEVAKLFYQAGIIVVCSFISPFAIDRGHAHELIPADRFFEVYIECSIEECINRDPKKLYQKALNNEISSFTGISSPYEAPKHPNLVINTEKMSANNASDKIIQLLDEAGII